MFRSKGPDGTLARLADLPCRRIFLHINNTNPILLSDSPERRAGRRRPASKSPMTEWRSDCDDLLTPANWKRGCAKSARDAITSCIRSIGCCTPGKCSKGQVQAWALNRYYYQAMIPLKDGSLIGRCEDSALRREWRKRLEDHDGDDDRPGGIERWLTLTDGLGLDRDDGDVHPAACCRPRVSLCRPTCITCASGACWRLLHPV